MTQIRFSRPPHSRRKVSLDNIVLFPASALPYKTVYQQIANQLPAGGVLIVAPKREAAQVKAVRATAACFRAKGHPVTLLPFVK